MADRRRDIVGFVKTGSRACSFLTNSTCKPQEGVGALAGSFAVEHSWLCPAQCNLYPSLSWKKIPRRARATLLQGAEFHLRDFHFLCVRRVEKAASKQSLGAVDELSLFLHRLLYSCQSEVHRQLQVHDLLKGPLHWLPKSKDKSKLVCLVLCGRIYHFKLIEHKTAPYLPIVWNARDLIPLGRKST